MASTSSDGSETLAAALSAAWSAVERVLNGNLAAIRGISYSEYRLLAAIGEGPAAGTSRVDLARMVGLSPSAVTRALRPLAELGMVVTEKHPRDARLAMTHLTPDGRELVSDAAGVVRDVMAQIAEKAPLVNRRRDALLAMLNELAQL